MRLDAVLAAVMGREPMNGIRIVGVDGPSGSGKSTVAAKLALLSGAPIVEIDDFGSWPDFAGWSRFDAQVLDPLLARTAATYQVRDWDNDEFGTSLRDWKTVPWAPLVIVEGVTCTRAEARLTYRIWVEAPQEIRLERGVQRDGEAHRNLWLSWVPRERAFFAADGTRARADLVLDGDPSRPHDAASEVVLRTS